jgi:arylsulfatase A-like enzyme
MTGRFPADLKVNANWNTGPDGAAANAKQGIPYHCPLPSEGIPNVPHLMKEAGYATAHFGKW